MDEMDVAIQYAFSMLNVPYVWGGNHPLEGMDCSGLVLQILRSLGVDPGGDHSSQMLYDHYLEYGTVLDKPIKGALVFFGANAKAITHVGFCLNRMQMIEAAGGGRRTRTIKDARDAGAMVRIRPIKRRKDIVGFIYPF